MAQEDNVFAAAALSGWIIYSEGGDNDLELEEWLQKYRPSRGELQNFAWIAVRASGRPKKARTEDDVNKESEDDTKMEVSAAKLASDLTEKIEAIENDPAIPVRAKKSKGEKSKKDMRDIEHELVKNRLKNLAIDSKLTSGKWMFFPSTETVDGLWTKIAKAIIQEDGPLRGKVYTAKVSTYQPGDGEKPAMHVICVYVEDSWNLETVGDAFKTLVKEVGVVPGSYKADIYTYAGIDSKHPSKMRSTLYGKNDFMSKEELDAHFEAKKAAEGPAPVVVKKAAKGTGFIESESSGEDEPKAKKSKK